MCFDRAFTFYGKGFNFTFLFFFFKKTHTPPVENIKRNRLVRFRSLLLTESRLIYVALVTKMFQFTKCIIIFVIYYVMIEIYLTFIRCKPYDSTRPLNSVSLRLTSHHLPRYPSHAFCTEFIFL